MEQSKTNTPETISLLDLILVLAKRWRFIFLFTGVFMVLVVLFSLYSLKMPSDSPYNPLPNVYKPEVKIRLQDSASSDTLSALLQNSDLGIFAGLAQGAGSGSQSADLAQALLKGNTLVDQLVKEFNFIEKYNLDKYPVTEARELITTAIKSDFENTTGILTISYEDIDPDFATKILNRALDLLEQRFKNLTLERVTSKRYFLTERISEVERDLKNAQNKLIDFQKKNGIVDIETQAQLQIEEIASLNAKIVALEMELQSLRQYRRPEDPQILRVEQDLKLNHQLLEMKKTGFNIFSSENIPTSQLPEISATYLNLRRDLAIHETVFSSLRQQLETTKLEEADDSKKFQIIERAEVPERKYKPSRGKLCIITSVSAFFLAIFISFIMEYSERVKQDPLESKKLTAIKEHLSLKRNKK